jgi:RNA polymerase sigma-70 factor, ECF subfamily
MTWGNRTTGKRKKALSPFGEGFNYGLRQEAMLLQGMMTERTSRDEQESFQALVLYHRQVIFRLAYHLTGNQDDAEDLVQDSLLEAFRSFRHFRLGSRFDRWMSQILTRNYIDKFRKRKRCPEIPLEEWEAEGEGRLAAPLPEVAGEYWREPIAQALAGLSPEYRTVVTLCDMQDLSYEEAGKVLRCPVGTVRSRLHRARDLLRKELKALRPGRGGN